MIGALAWFEQTPISAFVREDLYAYFVLLILHAWGMALLVGGGLAVGLRHAGVASSIPAERFAGFFPWMKLGAVLAILSGIGLLAGYPAKALTNWVFLLKFVLLAGAVLALRRLSAGEPGRGPSGRALALLSVALWLGGVAAGKLLLYTYSMLLTSD